MLLHLRVVLLKYSLIIIIIIIIIIVIIIIIIIIIKHSKYSSDDLNMIYHETCTPALRTFHHTEYTYFMS